MTDGKAHLFNDFEKNIYTNREIYYGSSEIEEYFI
jgi:hypothetical protein